MKREALTDKIFVLGVDGLDPSLAPSPRRFGPL